MKRTLPAYAASFRLGAKLVWHDKPELVSKLVIYATLLTMFATIYAIMPLEKLGIVGLTPAHMLWYFAMTETVTVSAQSLRGELRRTIAAGQLTVLIQQPCNMQLLLNARLLGSHVLTAALFLALASIALPFFGWPMPVPLVHLPLLAVSIILGGVIWLLLGYLVSMVEVLGPYAQPTDWIISKFIMTFGGLFFPVSFFPEWLRAAAMLTPFPYAIFVPGQFMIMPSDADIAIGLGGQVFWVVALIGIIRAAEGMMLRRVLVKGD